MRVLASYQDGVIHSPHRSQSVEEQQHQPSMTDADGYLAKPSGQCCLKGSLHDGEPRGKYEEIAGVNTYISSPSRETDNGNVVLYFPDVYGFFTNGLLVMDGFADAGYTVIGLDYFRGVEHSLRGEDRG